MSVDAGSSNWAFPVAAVKHVCGVMMISDMLLSPQGKQTGGLGLHLPSLER